MKSSGFLSESSNKDAAIALDNAIEYMKSDAYRKTRDATNIVPTHTKAISKNDSANTDDAIADDLASWREARLAELKRTSKKADDSGNFPEISEKEFFNGVIQREGGSRNIVIHLYKDSFQTCQIVNKLLGSIASRIAHTTFARINAEKAPFLVQKFEITMLPALLFFKEDCVIDGIIGLDSFGGIDITEDQLLEAVRSRFEK